MIDINFYRRTYNFNKQLKEGIIEYDSKEVHKFYESIRDRNPVVYNIETTNACNMKCKMCPRTTRMTRSISTLKRINKMFQ